MIILKKERIEKQGGDIVIPCDLRNQDSSRENVECEKWWSILKFE